MQRYNAPRRWNTNNGPFYAQGHATMRDHSPHRRITSSGNIASPPAVGLPTTAIFNMQNQPPLNYPQQDTRAQTVIGH
jgi:hypothetical protein